MSTESPVAARERVLYEDVFDTITHYAEYSPGNDFAPLFVEMAVSGSCSLFNASILDAGCGTGRGALALKEEGFVDVSMCDITPFGLLPEARQFPFYEAVLWQRLPRSYDFVYCCDVLEHIPKEYTMLVVSRLLEASRLGVFLSISLTRDVMGMWVGKPLHQTVESFVWWRDALDSIGRVVEARDLLNTGLYLLEPRC